MSKYFNTKIVSVATENIRREIIKKKGGVFFAYLEFL